MGGGKRGKREIGYLGAVGFFLYEYIWFRSRGAGGFLGEGGFGGAVDGWMIHLFLCSAIEQAKWGLNRVRYNASLAMERNFKLWFLSHGGKFHPDVDVVSNADGFYLCASNQRDLATRTCVVSCPHTLTISWFNAVLDLSLGDFDLHRINQSVLTRFFLVKQYLLQEKSSWWRYIQILPQPEDLRRLNTPLWYESGDFVWIHGTNLELSAQKLEASWHKEYEEAMNMFELGKSENIELWSWLVIFVGQCYWRLLRIQGHYTNGQQPLLPRAAFLLLY